MLESQVHVELELTAKESVSYRPDPFASLMVEVHE
jgi:hypothetical protein